MFRIPVKIATILIGHVLGWEHWLFALIWAMIQLRNIKTIGS